MIGWFSVDNVFMLEKTFANDILSGMKKTSMQNNNREEE